MTYRAELKLLMDTEEKATVVLISQCNDSFSCEGTLPNVTKHLFSYFAIFFYSPANISFFSRGISLVIKAAG